MPSKSLCWVGRGEWVWVETGHEGEVTSYRFASCDLAKNSSLYPSFLRTWASPFQGAVRTRCSLINRELSLTWKPEEKGTLKERSSPTAPDQGMAGDSRGVQPHIQIIRQGCGGETGLGPTSRSGSRSGFAAKQGHSNRDTEGTELKPHYSRALHEAGQHWQGLRGLTNPWHCLQ